MMNNIIKRLFALLAVILLVLVAVLTLYFAVTDNPSKMIMFKGCLGLMIFLPCAMWLIRMWHKAAVKIMEIRKKKIDESYKGQEK